MSIVPMVVQFLLSLSLLILLHEFGHFLPARLFKTRVEKFYLFFDAWGKSLFKKQIGGTEYGIGWLPLGGYVKISGMIDESMDTDQMKKDPEPYEFRSKKAWQRLIVMIGGVTVNFILGFFIFGMLLWTKGEEYLPMENAKYGIYTEELGEELGLKTGDKILMVGNKPLQRFDDRLVAKEIIFGSASTIKVERAGKTEIIPLPNDITAILTKRDNKDKSLFTTPMPFQLKEVSKGSIAEKAGLKAGDNLIGLNGKATPFYNDFVKGIADQQNKSIAITALRGTDTVNVTAQLDEKAKLGVAAVPFSQYYQTQKATYGFGESMVMGVQKGVSFIGNQLSAFGKMFSGEIKAKDSMGGFISIAEMYGSAWDWERFWNITAVLSLVLAFMNLLPIPGLDGGYVVFLLWEVVTGKRVSDEFMIKAVNVGFFIIMGLILFANGNDIVRKIFS